MAHPSTAFEYHNQTARNEHRSTVQDAKVPAADLHQRVRKTAL